MASPEVVFTAPWYMPILQVIVGGVLTFAGGYIGAVLIDKRRHKREERNLALAFRGEIAAIRKIVARRKYLEHLSGAIAHMKQTRQPMPITVIVRREYFNVFNKNVDKLGTLVSPLPEEIASFYTYATAVLEDFEALRNNELGDTFAQLLPALEELHGLVQEAMWQADSIVEAIGRAYP